MEVVRSILCICAEGSCTYTPDVWRLSCQVRLAIERRTLREDVERRTLVRRIIPSSGVGITPRFSCFGATALVQLVQDGFLYFVMPHYLLYLEGYRGIWEELWAGGWGFHYVHSIFFPFHPPPSSEHFSA